MGKERGVKADITGVKRKLETLRYIQSHAPAAGDPDLAEVDLNGDATEGHWGMDKPWRGGGGLWYAETPPSQWHVGPSMTRKQLAEQGRQKRVVRYYLEEESTGRVSDLLDSTEPPQPSQNSGPETGGPRSSETLEVLRAASPRSSAHRRKQAAK